MKKVLFAVCAVAFAAVAHAAAYNWSGSDVYQCWEDADSENLAAGTVYLFVEGVNGVTYSALSTAVSGGNFVSGAWGNKAVDSTSLRTNEGLFSDNYESATDYEGVNMYAVVLANGYYDGDTTTVTPIGTAQAYLTDTVAAGAQPTLGSAAVEFGSLEDTWAPAGWAAQSAGGGSEGVPEPTSGLLMLVGLGALALRRRRA